MDDSYRKFRVWLHSKPGMWTHYDGYVDVEAYGDANAFTKAVQKLRGTSFPDRPLDAWVLERVEVRS